MSEYKGIKGFQVQTRTEDPVPYAQALADNPYAGSWGSGGSLNTARSNHSGFGTQTSTISAGGYTTTDVAVVESYNGTSFTEVADLNSARRGTGSAGSANTAGITFGGGGGGASPGTEIALNESWNGSSWTEVGDLSTGRQLITGTGTQTAALAIGGGANPGQAKVESWDGSSWTEIADLNQLRNAGAASGLQPSAVFFGGYTTTDVANTENWNGSSWTEVSDLNTARSYLGGSDLSYTAALAFGGSGPSATTETWNGSAWTEVADMATARDSIGGTGGSNSSALVFGGYDGSTRVANTEEWSFSGLDPSTTPAADYADAIAGDFYYNSTTGQFKTVNDGGQPIGTWASASGINTGRSYFAGAGTATSSMVFGGYNAPGPPTGTTEDTEIWNGSSWTEVSNLNEAPYYNMAGSGASSTAALCYAGQGGGVRKNNAESWDGSSWTEITGLNTGRSGAAGVGPQTAAMCFGGNRYNPPPSVQYQAVSEIWNGSSWTETGDLNTARGDIAPVGSVYTDVLAVSGSTGSNTKVNEAFNGSSWTELADTNTTASSRSGSGVPAGPTAIVSGGYAPGVTANTEAWDGSSWTETGDLATARGKAAESASSTTGFQVGGETPSTPKNTNVEQFSFDDFQIKTVTTS